jgi:hypothetical protein
MDDASLEKALLLEVRLARALVRRPSRRPRRRRRGATRREKTRSIADASQNPKPASI